MRPRASWSGRPSTRLTARTPPESPSTRGQQKGHLDPSSPSWLTRQAAKVPERRPSPVDVRWGYRLRTVASTRSAAVPGSSCSQIRITVQPASASAVSVVRSRSTLVSSFRRHQPALVFGEVPCSGHRCQKQPSTNTATRARVNTMSGRVRPICGRAMFTRYRSPLRWSSRRMAISGAVWRFFTRLI